ncbi:MAG: Xaa-Pro peptidase family protein [Pseudomonadota bacterium]
MIAGFPRAEFERRCSALHGHMHADGIDALLLTTPADIFYVTGFLTRFWESPARPWFVILPAGKGPRTVIPSIGAPLMAEGFTDDILTWDAPHPTDDGVSLLSEALRAAVPAAGTLGLPMGLETHLRMPLADWGRVTQSLGARRIIDATHTVERVREIKSDGEIARIKATCALAAKAFAQVPDLVRAAPRLDAVARGYQAALLHSGADWVSYLASAAGPEGYGDIIAPAGPQPLRSGDVLMLDTGAVKDGYFCDFDRNFAIDPPSACVERTHKALFEATDEALAALQPGLRACDVHRILAEGLVARGAQPGGGRLGHGLGITLTEWPSFTPLDQTELRAGMVLTLEPSAQTRPGKLLVHEENIVLRADGAELLSPRAAPEMEVIPL